MAKRRKKQDRKLNDKEQIRRDLAVFTDPTSRSTVKARDALTLEQVAAGDKMSEPLGFLYMALFNVAFFFNEAADPPDPDVDQWLRSGVNAVQALESECGFPIASSIDFFEEFKRAVTVARNMLDYTSQAERDFAIGALLDAIFADDLNPTAEGAASR